MKISNSTKLVRACAITALAFASTSVLAGDTKGDGFVEVSLLWYIGGTQEYFECEVPPTALGTTQAGCHEHPVLDLKRDRIVGTAVDATADVFPAGDDALYATGTTTFELTVGRFAGSTLQVRGTGTIQPVVVGTPHFEWTSRAVDNNNTPISHVAGIFPEPGQNMVLAGTGVFKGATGTFGLFGGLDIVSSPDAGSFNCIFKIDLKIPRGNLLTSEGGSLDLF